MIRIVGQTKEKTLQTRETFSREDFSTYQWVWIDVENPSTEQLATIMNELEVQAMSLIRDATSVRRPKMEHYNEYDFYITHVLEVSQCELIKYELDIFVGENFIVTIHQQPLQMINDTWITVQNGMTFEAWPTYTIFHELMARMINDYYPLLEQIEDQLEAIEDNTKNKKMNALMNELYDVRRMLLHIGYTMTPMKDMLFQLLHTNVSIGQKYKRKHFTHLYDHLLKLSEMTMTNREITADIRDNYLSLNSYQTNNLMTILTIIASIFTPLTFIAGVYGMNFINMPELNWQYGYFIVLGLMGSIATLMFLWFKRGGWFKQS